MADRVTQINGQEVTLIDNGDGTFRIDLLTFEGRAFIREGELADLRSERDSRIAQRNERNAAIADLNQRVSALTATRADLITGRDEDNARITELNARISDLVDWLQTLGDPT